MPSEIVYLKDRATKRLPVSIVVVGNSVSIDKGLFIVECASEQRADNLADVLGKAYSSMKHRIHLTH